MTYVFLADGFEEIEALATVDILRRGGVEVRTVSITGEQVVCGSHNIPVIADITYKKLEDGAQCVILPGGMPGTLNLGASDAVENCVRKTYAGGGIIAAICAAPSVFSEYGLLDGKKATSYPDFEKKMPGCIYTKNRVETDGNIVTSRGAGTAHDFAFKLLAMLKDAETAENIRKAMIYDN